MSQADLLTIRTEGNARVVSFSRQHFNDTTTSHEIACGVGELLDEQDGSGADSFETLDLDLHQIDYLSSVALNQLIGINRRARANGIRLVLSNVQQAVCDVFALTRLERMFEVNSPRDLAEYSET